MTGNNKTLSDLNEKLHEQLNRLCNSQGEELKAEIERTRAVSGIAREIVDNAKLVLEAQRCLGGKNTTPKLLGISE